MADNTDINEQLGLNKGDLGEDTILFHTVDPTIVDPQDTETSTIGLKGVQGLVNISFDEDQPGGNADDEDLDISLINGLLYVNYIEPDPPFPPSERGKWIKHVLTALRTTNYRVWYLKSHDKHCIPFDTCRGFMYWDFDRELLFFIEINKYEQTYVNQKYPIAINAVGFDSILQIEGYHNMVDEVKNN